MSSWPVATPVFATPAGPRRQSPAPGPRCANRRAARPATSRRSRRQRAAPLHSGWTTSLPKSTAAQKQSKQTEWPSWSRPPAARFSSAGQKHRHARAAASAAPAPVRRCPRANQRWPRAKGNGADAGKQKGCAPNGRQCDELQYPGGCRIGRKRGVGGRRGSRGQMALSSWSRAILRSRPPA